MTISQDTQLAAKLRAILLAFRTELKPELSTAQAKLRGELIDMMLSRLSVEADGGDSGERFGRAVAALVDTGAGDNDAIHERLAAIFADAAQHEAADKAIAEIAASERDRRVAYEDRVAEAQRALPATRNSAGELAIAPEAFTAYLRARNPDDAQLRTDKVVTVPGGRSKGTILIDVTTAGGPRQIVMRKDFELSVTGTSVVYEFPIVRAAFEAGLPVPEPLWLEEDEHSVGGRFIAFERAPGKSMGTLFSSDASPAFARDFAAALARLHAVDIDAAGIGSHLKWGTDANPVRAMIDNFYARYRKDLRPNPLMDAAFAWLRLQQDKIGNERGLVHGDAGLHNTMGENDRLTALLDWEFSHAGDPAEDLTYCKYLIEKIVPWDDFMAAYRAAGGRPISEDRMRFFTIWRTLHLSILTGTAREVFEKGIDQDLRIATIGFTTFPKQLRDLAIDLAAYTS
jgi:aminoglycoside phosphotransferase (APT) family kinase protein